MYTEKKSFDTYHNLEWGDRILVRYDKGNRANKTFHVRGMVDGNVVMRFWSYRQQGWLYMVESFFWFDVRNREGRIKVRKNKK